MLPNGRYASAKDAVIGVHTVTRGIYVRHVRAHSAVHRDRRSHTKADAGRLDKSRVRTDLDHDEHHVHDRLETRFASPVACPVAESPEPPHLTPVMTVSVTTQTSLR